MPMLARRTKSPFKRPEVIRLNNFGKGLNDSVSPLLLEDDEVADIQNFHYDEKGTLKKRPGTKKRYAANFATGASRGSHNYRKESGASYAIFVADDKVFSDNPNFIQTYDSQAEWDTSGVLRNGVGTVEVAGDAKAVAGTLSALGNISLGSRGGSLGGTKIHKEKIWRTNSLDISAITDKTSGRITKSVNVPTGTSQVFEWRDSIDSGVSWGAWTAMGVGDVLTGVRSNANRLQVRFRANSTSGLRSSVQKLEVFFDQTSAVTQIDSGLSTNALPTFTVMNDTFFLHNGENSPRKWTGTGSMSAQAGSPPVGKWVFAFKNRMFVAGNSSNRSRIYFSDLGDPESWPALNFIDVGKGDGDEVTGIAELHDQVVITKENSVYVLQGDSPSNFVLRKATGEGGSMTMRSFGIVRSTLIWLSRDGVRLFDGVRTVLVSDHITKTLKGLNQTQLAQAVGVVHDNKYYLSVPNGEAQLTNNLVLVYDTINLAWTKYVGMNAASWLVWRQFGATSLFFGLATAGNVFEQDDTLYDDDGVAITAYVVTKAVDFGGIEVPKIVKASFMAASEPQELATAAKVYFRKDMGAFSSVINVTLTAGAFAVDRMIPGTVGSALVRSLAAKIQHDEVSKGFDLRAISFQYAQLGHLRETS